MKACLTILLAGFFAAIPARVENPYAANLEDPGTAYGMASEFNQLFALLSDKVLRDLVCRLSTERYTPERLSSAMGVPKKEVMHGINTLRSWGLVRIVQGDSANTIVERIPGKSEQTLRRWAAKYCGAADSCGTPNANSLEARDSERERTLGDGGIKSVTGGFKFGKKRRRMNLIVGTNIVLVELYDTPTADAIFSGAPFRSRIRNSSGRIYFRAPIQAEEEDEAVREIKVGDLVYSSADKTIEFGIESSRYFHGDQSQFLNGNKISLPTKSNLWAHAITDVREFFGTVEYGDEITVEVAK